MEQRISTSQMMLQQQQKQGSSLGQPVQGLHRSHQHQPQFIRRSPVPEASNTQVAPTNPSTRQQKGITTSQQATLLLSPTCSTNTLSPPTPSPPGLLQPPQPLRTQLLHLAALKRDLSVCSSLSKKVNLLSNSSSVKAFLHANRTKPVVKCLQRMSLQEQYVLLCLPAMGQERVLSQPKAASNNLSSTRASLTELAALLLRVEQFYDSIGGLVGYQAKSIELILEGDTGQQQKQQQRGSILTQGGRPEQVHEVKFHVPHALDLAGENTKELGQQVAMQGLMALPKMAEIYPVGGAGDRLGLECEDTGECLPAAMLPYSGRTMMEALIRDLQAREYLYFKLTGQQVTTPVAIMTSDAKGNHRRIMELMESMDWFGRGEESFRLFRQPLVPMISVEDGQWLLTEPLQVMAKPGGHGAIWKLMRDEGIFEWMLQQGRQAAILRQISNPIAGTDTTLLALAGRGQQQGSSFGFMSCDRAVGASEGCNALQERKTWKGGAWRYEYGYTNIEYTEFELLGMSDLPTEHSATTSKFPANTNVLYVDLHAALGVVEQAVKMGSSEQLMPGLIFNRNKFIAYSDPLEGTTAQKLRAGRMECTMQNIADYMTDRKPEPIQPEDPECHQLSTFLVYNERRKVTSSAKKRREPGSLKISQTPDGSFYDLQRNAWHLLQQCGMVTPPPVSVQQYLEDGPGFLFLYHPSLGPLWDVISQKIRGGELKSGAEMVLELAEASLDNVTVDGSFLVYADNTIGHRELSIRVTSNTTTQLHSRSSKHSSIRAVLNNITSSNILSGSTSSSSSGISTNSGTRSSSSYITAISSGSPLGSSFSSSNGSSVVGSMPHLQQPPLPITAAPAAPTHDAPSSTSSSDSSAHSSLKDSSGLLSAATTNGARGTYLAVQQGQDSEAGAVGGSAGAPGAAPGQKRLVYSSNCGRVRLHNVLVQNKGVDWRAPGNVYWKHQVTRLEATQVHLHGHSEFEAQDVIIEGDQCFVVPDGQRMVVRQATGGGLDIHLSPLPSSKPSWHWAYRLDAAGRAKLELCEGVA